MKTFLILLLAGALAGAAIFTRPSEASFKDIVNEQVASQSGGIMGAIVKGAEAKAYLSNAGFKDHYLWTSIDKDGKTQYVGAFGHWFELNVTPVPPQKANITVKLPV
jgi:hypothetical protein